MYSLTVKRKDWRFEASGPRENMPAEVGVIDHCLCEISYVLYA